VGGTIASVGELRCLGDKRVFPIRGSNRRVVVGVIRMSECLQIEGVKVCWLRDKSILPPAYQCECYCFHIFLFSRYYIFSALIDPSFRSRCIIDISYSLSRKLMLHAGRPSPTNGEGIGERRNGDRHSHRETCIPRGGLCRFVTYRFLRQQVGRS
jgi:hypothetical protein